MYNNSILQIIRDSEQFYAIAGGLRRGAGEVQLYGLPEGMKGLWLAAMLDEFNPILVVTPGSEEAQRLAADIESFWPGRALTTCRRLSSCRWRFIPPARNWPPSA